MPRITKAMLEEENLNLKRRLEQGRFQYKLLEEKVSFLEKYSAGGHMSAIAMTFQRVGDSIAQITTCNQKAIETLIRRT